MKNDVPAANGYDSHVLRNSLPHFLEVLADILEGKLGPEGLAAASKTHGRERADLPEYTLKQVLWEYHHLRKTLVRFLSNATDDERVRMHDYLDKAIAEAAEEYHTQCISKETEERKRTQVAKDSLSAEQAMRERFVLALSHDLRAPVSTAKMAAEQMAAFNLPIECQKLPSMIIRNLDRTIRMVEDLLDSNHIQAGRTLVLNISQADLYQIASEAVEDLCAMYGARFVLEGHSVRGHWDKRYLRRIIENLCSNAIKYGAASHPIRIFVGDDGDSAILCVQNKGEPIPPHVQEQMFEQFRANPDDKETIGWGLGLTIVRGAVQAHGGSIAVSSTAETGTEIKIILPKSQ